MYNYAVGVDGLNILYVSEFSEGESLDNKEPTDIVYPSVTQIDPRELCRGLVYDPPSNSLVYTPKPDINDVRLCISATDWKVTRHRDQVDAGVTTSLTSTEYSELLSQRQLWRDQIVHQ